MKIMLLLALLVPTLNLANPPKAAKVSGSRLFCKTGPEKRAPGQALKLYLNYNLPFVFEAEDPTLPYGRQVVLLAGRPVVQLFFEKAPGPAGENGELLQPMQCAFARRAVRASEPSQVQVLLNPNQVSWISQAIGQRGGAAERALVQPGGDWAFAYEPDRIFSVELDNPKTFITNQMPK